MMRLLALFSFMILSATVWAEITPSDTMPPPAFGAIRERLAGLEARVPAKPDAPQLVPTWSNLNTALRKARFMLDHYRLTPYLLPLIDTELQTADNAVKSLTKGMLSRLQPGLLGEGYYSSIDDSFQPFLRYVPPQAAEGKKLPMIVFLHGYASYLDLVNWSSFPASLIAYAEQNGFYLVAPFGRSNTDFQGIGEQDVMRVIHEMEQRYGINSERIILSGISMGGMGVWTIGAHHPDRFAGLLVISGRGDYYFWQGVKPQDCSLELGIFGAEPWTNEMRQQIEARLGISAVDIYGLSEVIGPGVAVECSETKDGPTIWEDHFYPEIVDPQTGEVLEDGQDGELVFTSLSKEAFPIIRYRTRDLTKLLAGTARPMRRFAKITGRCDDMMIMYAVNKC